MSPKGEKARKRLQAARWTATPAAPPFDPQMHAQSLSNASLARCLRTIAGKKSSTSSDIRKALLKEAARRLISEESA
jgi:hypothetical protein